MDSNHQFRAEIGNAFIGAAPSSGVRRAMRKVASLAMRRHRGFAQRSHSARQLASSSGTRSTGSLTKRLQERRRRMIARLADRGKRIVWKVERSSHCLKAGGTSRRAEFPASCCGAGDRAGQRDAAEGGKEPAASYHSMTSSARSRITSSNVVGC